MLEFNHRSHSFSIVWPGATLVLPIKQKHWSFEMHSFKPLSTVPGGQEHPLLQLSESWHWLVQAKVEHDKSHVVIQELNILPFVQLVA